MDDLAVREPGYFDHLTLLGQPDGPRIRRSLTKENPMKPDIEQRTNRVRRADHWIYLDRTWAQWLGVKRTAGVYRIRSRELLRRMSRESLGMDASGQVINLEEPGAPRPETPISQEPRRRSA